MLEEIFIKHKLINSRNKLDNNYKNKFLKMDDHDKKIISDSYPLYESLVDKLLSYVNNGYKYCEQCNAIMSWKNVNKTCSRTCANKSIKENYVKNVQEKYGVSNTSKLKSVQEKIKKTNLERYGVEVASQNDYVKSKIKKTNTEKYGGNSPQCDNNIVNKTKETVYKKYGVTCFLQSEHNINYCKEKMIEKYGVGHYSKTTEFKEHMKQINLQRYNTESIFVNEDFIQANKDKMIKKYGVDHYSKTTEFKERMKQITYDRYGVDYIFNKPSVISNRKHISILNKQKYINDKLNLEITTQQAERMKFSPYKKDYSKEYLKELLNYSNNENYKIDIKFFREEFGQPYVREVASKYGHDREKRVSSYEYELVEFLKSNNIECIVGNRKIIAPYELDIYIPEHKLAIEFNGSYWHSDKFVDKNYHQMKTKMCNELGITLIHIHEYMYMLDGNITIYENIIKSKLQLNERVYARKCILKEVPKQEEKEFLNKYHLQGFVGSNKCYGLYYNDELMTLCSFGKSRFNKKYEYELLRNCSKPNITVVGGLSKIIKHYKKEIDNKEIICYSDASISYNKSSELTQPNYVWIKNGIVYKRYQTQKHKLSKLLGDSFDENLSESENMKNNNFIRVYDSGNYITIY